MTNQTDARYIKQEESICRGLDKALEKRRIGMRVKELCQEAQVTSPTFYAHHKSCDEALAYYELRMEEVFIRLLPKDVKRDVTFMKLLGFVVKHQHYFAATFHSRNLYLLIRLVGHAFPYKQTIHKRAYTLYTWSIGAIIFCFGECDKFAEKKIETYHKILMKLRMTDWW